MTQLRANDQSHRRQLKEQEAVHCQEMEELRRTLTDHHPGTYARIREGEVVFDKIIFLCVQAVFSQSLFECLLLTYLHHWKVHKTFYLFEGQCQVGTSNTIRTQGTFSYIADFGYGSSPKHHPSDHIPLSPAKLQKSKAGSSLKDEGCRVTAPNASRGKVCRNQEPMGTNSFF